MNKQQHCWSLWGGSEAAAGTDIPLPRVQSKPRSPAQAWRTRGTVRSSSRTRVWPMFGRCPEMVQPRSGSGCPVQEEVWWSRRRGEGWGGCNASLPGLRVEEPVCSLHAILKEKDCLPSPPDRRALHKARSLQQGIGLWAVPGCCGTDRTAQEMNERKRGHKWEQTYLSLGPQTALRLLEMTELLSF